MRFSLSTLLAAACLSFACSTSADRSQGDGVTTEVSAPRAESQAPDAVGTFRPTGPPQQPIRVPVGDKCVVDLKQEYEIDGTLEGRMLIDFRIFVDGPCGVPPGTHEEHWIAHGRYSVGADAEDVSGSLVYLATVAEGGRVDGAIGLEGGLIGQIEVHGVFTDGFMRYEGNVRRSGEIPGGS